MSRVHSSPEWLHVYVEIRGAWRVAPHGSLVCTIGSVLLSAMVSWCPGIDLMSHRSTDVFRFRSPSGNKKIR